MDTELKTKRIALSLNRSVAGVPDRFYFIEDYSTNPKVKSVKETPISAFTDMRLGLLRVETENNVFFVPDVTRGSRRAVVGYAVNVKGHERVEIWNMRLDGNKIKVETLKSKGVFDCFSSVEDYSDSVMLIETDYDERFIVELPPGARIGITVDVGSVPTELRF